MEKHTLQVTLLKNGELCYEEALYNEILYGIAFAGINCKVSINKEVSESNITFSIDDNDIVTYNGKLNNIQYDTEFRPLKGDKVAAALNKHVLKLDDRDYIYNDLNHYSLFGKLKYVFSDTKNRSGENCYIITPFCHLLYNIKYAKNLNHILTLIQYFTMSECGRQYGLKRALITTEGVELSKTFPSLENVKNYVSIELVPKIEMSPLYVGSYKYRIFNITIAGVSGKIRFTSDESRLHEYYRDSISTKINNFTATHLMGIKYHEHYSTYLNELKNEIISLDTILGGIKNKFLEGMDVVIEDFNNCVN